jgi:aminopeptidase YwaD
VNKPLSALTVIIKPGLSSQHGGRSLIDTHPEIPFSAQRALQLTRDWIQTYGGRLAGSEACRKTALAIQSELQRACGAARLESFQTHPEAFGKFYRIDCCLYLAAVVLLWLNQPLAAAIFASCAVVGAGLEFGWYVELYDRLYPQKECYNVSAVLEPRGEARQQLIVSGHHDSAQELSFLKGSQKWYGLKILLPDIFRMLAAVSAWGWVLGWWLYKDVPGYVPLVRVLLCCGIFSVFTKFFLFSPQATPGAGDNLIASAMVVELARRFAERPGQSILEHTRLIFLSFDAEESGVRGSRAWVRDNLALLHSLPTNVLNIDSIYTLRDLQFLVSDLNSHVALSQTLAQTCIQIARDAGFMAAPAKMLFGGGSTDAAEFARHGIQATTMIAMPTTIVRDRLVYHTMQDTVDAIEPAAVEACLAVAERLAFSMDTHVPGEEGDSVPFGKNGCKM